MDAEYVVDSMAEVGFLTPLEKVIIESHPGFWTWAYREFETENLLQVDEIVGTCMRLWQESSPEFRYYAAQAARCNWQEGLETIEKRMIATIAMLSGTGSVSRMHISMDVPPWGNKLHTVQSLQALPFKENKEEDTRFAFDILTQYIKERLMVQYTEMQVAFTDDRPVVDESRVFETVVAAREAFCPSRLTPRPLKRPSPSFLEKTEAKLRAQGKRALRRAYNFFMDHDREEELRLFVSGNEVEVSHRDSDLKFIFKRADGMNLVDRSIESKSLWNQWSNVDVSVCTKTGVFLTGLCVYIKDTPVLDQLMALIMMVEAGMEEELLGKGNVKRTSHDVDFDALVLKSPKLQAKLSAVLKSRKEYAERKESGYINTRDLTLTQYTHNLATTTAIIRDYNSTWFDVRFFDDGATITTTSNSVNTYTNYISGARVYAISHETI